MYGSQSEHEPTEGVVRDSRPIPFEDVELIEQIKGGNTEAYGILVRKYQDRVFNACWRICGHQDDALDLTQEAFLKAFDKLSDFEHRSGFYTWIFRIAVNMALSHRRNTKRRNVQSLDQLEHAGATQASELAREMDRRVADDPSLAAGKEELHRDVARALHTLDDEHRAVIVLRDIEGFDYKEIAEILSVPPGTVKSRLHRARLAIKDAIRPAKSP